MKYSKILQSQKISLSISKIQSIHEWTIKLANEFLNNKDLSRNRDILMALENNNDISQKEYEKIFSIIRTHLLHQEGRIPVGLVPVIKYLNDDNSDPELLDLEYFCPVCGYSNYFQPTNNIECYECGQKYIFTEDNILALDAERPGIYGVEAYVHLEHLTRNEELTKTGQLLIVHSLYASQASK